MNWLQKISMSVPEALGILEFPIGSQPSLEEIDAQWKKMIFKHHPDRGGDESLAKKINSARTFLQSSYGSEPRENYRNPPWGGYSRQRGREVPEWQTDERSSYNEINEQLGRGDINYCKWEIYESSLENGPVEEYTFWAYDGRFLRGVFSAKSNPESFGIAGEVMEEWNGSGNAYNTVAVLAVKPGAQEVKLIRLQGEDFSGQEYWLSFDSMNSNPGNDPRFTRKLNELIESI